MDETVCFLRWRGWSYPSKGSHLPEGMEEVMGTGKVKAQEHRHVKASHALGHKERGRVRRCQLVVMKKKSKRD